MFTIVRFSAEEDEEKEEEEDNEEEEEEEGVGVIEGGNARVRY